MIVKKRYANIKEISEYTSLPTGTLYEWASQGKIPSIKFGRRVLFDLEDVDKAMELLKRNAENGDKTVNKIIGEIDENHL